MNSNLHMNSNLPNRNNNDKEKKAELIENVKKVKVIGIFGFVITLLGIVSFIVGIFSSTYSFANIVSSNATVNPFLMMGNNFLQFFTTTNNIVFGSLMGLTIILLYLGLFLIPSINICKCLKTQNRRLLVSAIFTSFLSFVLLPLAPLAWLVASVVLFSKCDSLLEDEEENETMQENKNANTQTQIKNTTNHAVQFPNYNSFENVNPMNNNNNVQGVNNGMQQQNNQYGNARYNNYNNLASQKPIVVRRNVPQQQNNITPGMRTINTQQETSIIRPVGQDVITIQHVQPIPQNYGSRQVPQNRLVGTYPQNRPINQVPPKQY